MRRIALLVLIACGPVATKQPDRPQQPGVPVPNTEPVLDIAPAADPDAAFAEARRLRAAGRGGEARRMYAAALAGYERKLGQRVRIGVPTSSYTNAIAASKLIAFARHHEIVVYDPTTWQPVRRLVDPSHGEYVRGLAIASDGSKLVASYGANDFVLWDLATGKIARTFEHPKSPGELAWSADGKLIVSASSSSVRIWDAATGARLHDVAIANANVMIVTRDQILTGDFQGVVTVIDLRGRVLRTLRAPKGTISRLELSADGKTLAVSIEDSPSATIHLFDFASGRRTRSFSLLGHGTLSPDGKRLAGSHETGMQVIDLARGVPVVVDKQLAMPRYLADGTLLALDTEGGVVAVDPAGKSAPLVPVPRPPSDVAFGSGSRMVVHTRQGIELCDLGPALDCRELPGHYRDVAYKNQTLAAIRDADGTVEVWDAQLRAQPRLLTTPKDHMIPQHNNKIAMSADGRRAVTSEYQLHVLDLAAGTELHPGKKLDGRGVAVSPDGKLAAAPWGPNAALYDLATGTQVAKIALPGEPDGIAFDAAGRRLATGSMNTVTVTDVATGATLDTTKVELEKHGRITAVAFVNNGRRLVASFGRRARIFDLPGLRAVATLEGHLFPVFGVAVRPDDRVIATASSDGLVRLWSLDGAPLGALGFVGGDSAYLVDPARERVELYGNARRWLTCDIGTASFPFELCEDRVSSPGLAARATQVDSRVVLAPLPRVTTTVAQAAAPATYKRVEDLVFQSRGNAVVPRLIERTRYHAWFSTDGKTILTTGGADGSILANGKIAKLDVADGFEITLSADETRAAIVQARAPLSVVDVPSGKLVWEHQHGIGCAARWTSPTTLVVHDDNNDAAMWRIDLATGKANQLGGKRRADACWASRDGKRWFVRDDYAKYGGVVWRIDGATGAATIWLENVDELVGSLDANRFCYKRRSDAVYCRADGGLEERVADEGYGLQLDDTGRTLLFSTRGVFFAADTSAKTVRALSTMVGRSGAVQAVLSGGDVVVGGGSSGVEVFDLRARTKQVIPGAAFYGVRAIPGRPRAFTIEKEVNNLQDLYLAEL